MIVTIICSPKILTISVSKITHVFGGMSGGFPPRPNAKSGCIETTALSPTVIVLMPNSNPFTTLPGVINLDLEMQKCCKTLSGGKCTNTEDSE